MPILYPFAWNARAPGDRGVLELPGGCEYDHRSAARPAAGSGHTLWEDGGGGDVDDADVSRWIEDVKARPGSSAVGMLLTHHGVVRGTSRSGEPVRGMNLSVDHDRLERALFDAADWPGIFAVKGWVDEGELAVGDDIMRVLVAGDIRENVFAALQWLVEIIKTEVVIESELR